MYHDLNATATSAKYERIVNMMIDNCASIREVEQILTDTCLNGYEVIDLLAYEKLESIISNQSVGLIVADFWNGPFYRKTFMTPSTNFQIITSNLMKPKAFYEYLPDKVEEISAYIKERKINKKRCCKLRLLKQQSHFFKIETWKKSMDVIYLIDGLLIASIAIFIQAWFIDMIALSNSSVPYFIEYGTLQAQYQDTSLTESAKTSIMNQIISVEDKLLPIVKEMCSMYENYINMEMIMTMYFVK